MTQDVRSRMDEIELELAYLNVLLEENPFNASANSRYKYLYTILTELRKHVSSYN